MPIHKLSSKLYFSSTNNFSTERMKLIWIIILVYKNFAWMKITNFYGFTRNKMIFTMENWSKPLEVVYFCCKCWRDSGRYSVQQNVTRFIKCIIGLRLNRRRSANNIIADWINKTYVHWMALFGFCMKYSMDGTWLCRVDSTSDSL